MIYRVSYVVRDGSQKGSIKNEQHRPTLGDFVHIEQKQYRVVDVHEIMPPCSKYLYLHATVEQVVEARA